jgi:hypothetical protein
MYEAACRLFRRLQSEVVARLLSHRSLRSRRAGLGNGSQLTLNTLCGPTTSSIDTDSPSFDLTGKNHCSGEIYV